MDALVPRVPQVLTPIPVQADTRLVNIARIPVQASTRLVNIARIPDQVDSRLVSTLNALKA